ncbi:MAG: carbon-nitrogen hydrolase family protein [Actinomycetota bacterium]
MRVGMCQLRAGDDLAANLVLAEDLIGRAAGAGADLAALPEVFDYHGPFRGVREAARTVPGEVSDRIGAAAREAGMWVLAGSILELEGDDVFNTSLLFDRSGELVARYRKIHLFDVELEGQPPIKESTAYAAGRELVTAETEFGRIGLSICYDVRFPELYRGLMALGAGIVFVPSAFTHTTGEAHWHSLLRARAIENQCFVIAPAQWGTWGSSDDPRRCYGHSLAVDPWGRILAEGPEEGDTVVTAEVDLAELRRVRTTLPALQHRRLGPAR